jgi:NAD+ kinase
VKIAIYGKHISENYLPFVQSLLANLNSKKIELTIFEPFYDSIKERINFEEEVDLFKDYNEIKNVDYLFSIGGDGTLLETITLVRDSNIPILGINTGRLGYLSSVSTEEVDMAIDNILTNNFDLDKRTLLDLNTENDIFGEVNFALNEITLQKKDTSSMVTIHAYLDGEFLNSYWADGLIISTPTGSTAYSLSCNGPIVLPNSGNIIITPIAPHNLNVRPLVIPDDKELTLKIEGRTENFLVAVDSRSKALPLSTELIVKKSKHQINLIRLKEHNYLNTLRNKLMWGVDKRN